MARGTPSSARAYSVPSRAACPLDQNSRAGPVWSSVAAFLGWSEERARELVEFGGVYYKPSHAPSTAKPKRELDPERHGTEERRICVYSCTYSLRFSYFFWDFCLVGCCVSARFFSVGSVSIYVKATVVVFLHGCCS